MGLWQEYKDFKEYRSMTMEDLLLQAGVTTEEVTKKQALNIPTVSACVELITNTVALLPVKLYEDIDNKVLEVNDDNRVKLLNDDTGDTLNGFQFKKALVTDYLLNGAGYAYINRDRNNIKSLHFVDDSNVSVNVNVDPIFKQYDILVNGAIYRDFEFIKITRKSKDGVTGKGIIEENNKILSVAYNSLTYEELLVKTGGNKKGFLQTQGKLSKEAVTELKGAWNNLYKNNTENVVVLNNGLDFKEASQSSVEMQLVENKQANAAEICKMFNVPVSVLAGNADTQTYNNFIKTCILPLLSAIEASLNKDLLLQKEKGESYFNFDTSDLLKGDILTRYQAYSEAVKSGWISKNEVRHRENYERIEGLDIVSMNLGDVIYDVKAGQYFTPNTKIITKSGSFEQSNTDEIDAPVEE